MGTEEMTKKATVLELIVNNHPGVMSHVCGLFSRRAYNLEGILCMPLGSGEHSKIWLRMHEEDRLEQIVKQLQKLEDVSSVVSSEIARADFAQLEDFFRGE